jgi:hypothetical protein
MPRQSPVGPPAADEFLALDELDLQPPGVTLPGEIPRPRLFRDDPLPVVRHTLVAKLNAVTELTVDEPDGGSAHRGRRQIVGQSRPALGEGARAEVDVSIAEEVERDEGRFGAGQRGKGPRA